MDRLRPLTPASAAGKGMNRRNGVSEMARSNPPGSVSPGFARFATPPPHVGSYGLSVSVGFCRFFGRDVAGTKRTKGTKIPRIVASVACCRIFEGGEKRWKRRRARRRVGDGRSGSIGSDSVGFRRIPSDSVGFVRVRSLRVEGRGGCNGQNSTVRAGSRFLV
jgi:hypothetical protein